MEFRIVKRQQPNREKYKREDYDLALNFARDLHKECGNFIKGIILFGSAVRREKKSADIDILVVVDDLSIFLTAELVEAYRIITEKLILKHSARIHVTSLRFSSFWEYVRTGDPIAVNMLRDGLALMDTGFFDPLQVLLRQGRIRPTPESVFVYFSRAPRTLFNSRWHLLEAALDLYWAAIDAAHAALMKQGEIPPSPEHVADLMEVALVKKNLVSKKYVLIMRNLYALSKKIVHRELRDISGQEFERLYVQAADFVDKMKDIVER